MDSKSGRKMEYSPMIVTEPSDDSRSESSGRVHGSTGVDHSLETQNKQT